jgi:hypothetical protein
MMEITDKTFDRILAHPPTPQIDALYHDLLNKFEKAGVFGINDLLDRQTALAALLRLFFKAGFWVGSAAEMIPEEDQTAMRAIQSIARHLAAKTEV